MYESSSSSFSVPAAAAGAQDACSATKWFLAIRSASELGRPGRAFSLYAAMLVAGIRPDPFSVAAALKAAGRLPSGRSSAATAALHAQLRKLGHHSHIHVGTSLLDACSKHEGIHFARKLFDEMPLRSVVTWNSMLAAWLRAKDLDGACVFFDGMPVRDAVPWNSLITGHANAGDMSRALQLFRRMPEKNPASWNAVISAHADLGDMATARELFDEMPERNNVTWVSMISGYSQCGDVDSAAELFEEMVDWDVSPLNAMISCYAQNGRPREAIHLFNRMRKPDIDVRPNEKTFSSAISACSQLSNQRIGSWIEKYMDEVGIEMDDHLRTALMVMYSTFGDINKAWVLFQSLMRKDVVAYSAMVLGCGINNRVSDAVTLFDEMLDMRVAPNATTFAGLLTAYNHAGLVEEARECFVSMRSKFGVVPSADHYAIMVDVLARKGSLQEAHQIIEGMPMEPSVEVWGALLLGCRLHGNVELGEVAAKRCFEMDPNDGGYYIILARIYAEAGNWGKARRMWKFMKERRLSKTPGYSWFSLTSLQERDKT